MDQNRDGVVTIDEFIDSCKKVQTKLLSLVAFSFNQMSIKWCFSLSVQDENIMQSMELFDNVI